MNKSEQNVFFESEGMIAWEKKDVTEGKEKEKERIKQKKINKRQQVRNEF